MRAFWVITQKQQLYQIRGLCYKTNNSMGFHSRLFPGKTNYKVRFFEDF